jgi:predicted transcriptional regulator
MPWKEIDIARLAKDKGIDLEEVTAKQKLMLLIHKTRKANGVTQTELGRIVGVSQARIAQIETGVGTSKITFDVLFRILSALGKGCRVVVHASKKHGSQIKHKTSAKAVA